MTDETTMAIADLLYARHAEALDIYLEVESMEDDGSKDWVLFQRARFDTARAAEEYWLAVKTEYMNTNREQLKRIWGL